MNTRTTDDASCCHHRDALVHGRALAPQRLPRGVSSPNFPGSRFGAIAGPLEQRSLALQELLGVVLLKLQGLPLRRELRRLHRRPDRRLGHRLQMLGQARVGQQPRDFLGRRRFAMTALRLRSDSQTGLILNNNL